jgi:hypothetical protein
VPDSTGGSFNVTVGQLAAGQHAVTLLSIAPSGNAPLSVFSPGTPLYTINLTSRRKGAAVPAINGNAPGSITSDTSLGSNPFQTVAVSPPSGTVVEAGNRQAYPVIVTPTDAIDYTTATAMPTIAVAKAARLIDVSGNQNGSP